MKKCDFSLEHYKDCLKLALSKGYTFMTMEKFNEQSKQLMSSKNKIIVIRHDLDFDVKLALNFSKIEKELGIKSTYFVRLHAKYYSPFSSENHSMINDLLKEGHEVGLHYDAGFADLSNEKPEEVLLRDKETFENLLGKSYSGISTHEPTRTGFVLSKELLNKAGLKYDAYSELFLKDMKYISDSSCRWREGCMCNFIEKETPFLCILTHPIWWFNKNSLENY